MLGAACWRWTWLVFGRGGISQNLLTSISTSFYELRGNWERRAWFSD
jgi:hypothetical protein